MISFLYKRRWIRDQRSFGDYPSDALIHRLADALEADEDELLVLAKRVPVPGKKRVLQRPDALRAFAECDDATLDKLMTQIGQSPTPRKTTKRKTTT